MKSKLSGIYALCCPTTGNVRYVGQSVDINKRYRQHCAMNTLSYRKDYWIKTLSDQGLAPVLKVLELTESLDVAEKRWIDSFSSKDYGLLNMTSGGQDVGDTFNKAAELMPWHPKKAPLNVSLAAVSRTITALEREGHKEAADKLRKKQKQAKAASMDIKKQGNVFWVMANLMAISNSEAMREKYLPTLNNDLAQHYVDQYVSMAL